MKLLLTVSMEYDASIDEFIGLDKLEQEAGFLKKYVVDGWCGENIKLRKFELKRLHSKSVGKTKR